MTFTMAAGIENEREQQRVSGAAYLCCSQTSGHRRGTGSLVTFFPAHATLMHPREEAESGRSKWRGGGTEGGDEGRERQMGP